MQTYTIKDFLEVKSAGSGSFSPDGKKISFQSNLSGTSQLYVMPAEGGDAEQITSYEDSVSFSSFSPTENKILFGKSAGGDEQTQLYVYSLDTKETEELTANPQARYNFGQFSRDGKAITYSHNARNGKDFDVYMRDLETGIEKCVFDKGGSCYPAGLSPDKSMLVVKVNQSNVHQDLFIVTLADRSIEQITSIEEPSYYSGASWLPDGSGFYVITDRDRDFAGLCKYDLSKRQLEFVLTPDWDVDSANVSLDGSLLKVSVNEDGYNKLRLYSLPGMTPIELPGLPATGTVYSSIFSKDASQLSLCIGDSRNTRDIWIYSLESHECKRLTKSPQDIPAEELIEPSLFRFTSFDGLIVPAFLYMPKIVGEGKKVPVIINIHGGPESQYTPSLALLIQYFVYQGYAVIAPNVRGSSGYGKAYLALDDVEKRLDSVHDLASLHDHIKTMPMLDPERVALMGGSYGGYMTLAGLAFYPDLWVGGVDIVGIANFVTFLENTAPYRRAIREAEYGSLEKDRQLLHDISPINHIEKIKAPLLMIHGANDPRVPLSEAEQMVQKLEALGRKPELLVYADEGHGLSKLKNRLDAYPKVAAFLRGIMR